MTVDILIGDCRTRLAELPDQSVQCCVTSPPYFGLRDYGCDGQIGLEATPDAFVAELVAVFREVRRVLRNDGTLWLNLGDSYCTHPHGHLGANASDPKLPQARQRGAKGAANRKPLPGIKHKDLIGIPWMVAFALRADGWFLRQDIIWSKPNPMPESVTDRCTKAHEYLFLLSKSARYHFDADAIAEPAISGNDLGLSRGRSFNDATRVARHAQSIQDRQDAGIDSREAGDGERNKRSVWTVPTQPFSEAHFATFPPALVEPCILAGCPKGGMVLDPFGGAGTTGLVADRLGRDCTLIELNPAYAEIARNRLKDDAGMFAEVAVA